MFKSNCDEYEMTFRIIRDELHREKYTMKVLHEKTGVSMRQIARLLNNQLICRDKAIRKIFKMMLGCVKSNDLERIANRIVYEMAHNYSDSPEADWVVAYVTPYKNLVKNYPRIRDEIRKESKK